MTVATLVAESDRLSFLPALFGERLMMRGEAQVYAWMSRLSKDYNGGHWQFYTLSNGGFYMAPDVNKPLRLVVEGNWFDGVLSADAAGIVATLFALNQLMAEVDGTHAGKALLSKYCLLCEFASEHEEASLIGGAID